MEETIKMLFKFFTEPAQILFIVWLIICHMREKADRIIIDKLHQVNAANAEVNAGTAKTIDMIMTRLGGGGAK
jgi:hypothetical protein